MAKKKVKRKVARKRVVEKPPAESPPRQAVFEGEGFPKPPPKAVCKARDEYLQARRDAAEASSYKADRHQRLVEVMKEHGINRIKFDDESKFFELTADEKVKTRTIPKDKRDNGASDD